MSFDNQSNFPNLLSLHFMIDQTAGDAGDMKAFAEMVARLSE